MKLNRTLGPAESGSAFVISILVLFILSVLGMALMLTTTTETDISVNYRWGEMAFFNADAALEYGKNVLAAYALRDGDLQFALPPARTQGQIFVTQDAAWGEAIPETPCFPSTAGCRDYQYFVDTGPNADGQYTRTYIGRVLRDVSNRAIQYDFRQPTAGDTRGDIDNDSTADVTGTVTLWVRRPIWGDQDIATDNTAILTAEGTAPNYDFAAGTGRPGSVRRLEMTVSIDSTSGVAGSRYSDVTRSSDPNATVEEGWRTVDRIQ